MFAYIGGKYSLRRHVAPHGEKIPIFTFPTQQWSVLHAVAAAQVLEAWYREVAPIYADPKATHSIKHGLAVLVKATVIVNRWSVRTKWPSDVVLREHSTYASQGTNFTDRPLKMLMGCFVLFCFDRPI